MVRIKEAVDILQIHGVTEQGATMPIRVSLSNGKEAVAKYPNNNCGNQILVNEFVCSCIGDAIELAIPDFGIGYLSEEVIWAAGGELGLDEANCGMCFYTKYIPNGVPVTAGPLMSLHIDTLKIERLILFDHIIGNYERHNGNLLLDISKEKRLYAIDHGTIFTTSVRYGLKDLINHQSIDVMRDPSILNENQELYHNLLLMKRLDPAELWSEAQAMQHILSYGFFQSIKKSIPNEWISLVGNDTIDRLLETIQCRVIHLKEIYEMIMSEGRSF